MQALSQLSYGPAILKSDGAGLCEWPLLSSACLPHAIPAQSAAIVTELARLSQHRTACTDIAHTFAGAKSPAERRSR
jgi:hypothetical protein